MFYVGRKCASFSHLFNEDKESYQRGWEPIGSSPGQPEYTHTAATKLNAVPRAGLVDMYRY